MTFTYKFFMLAEKCGLLTNIGIILHSLISLLVLVPYIYVIIFSINNGFLKSGLSTVAVLHILVYVLQLMGQGLTAFYLYKKYLMPIAKDGLTELKFLYLMIPALAMPWAYLIFTICTSYLPNFSSAYLTIAFCIGIVFLILPTILSLLVIGVSCSKLSYKANVILLFGVHEDKVTELVKSFYTLRNKASPHLFVVYTITILHLILDLYTGLITTSCFITDLVLFLIVL